MTRLPGLLGEIAGVAGERAALQIAGACGGTRAYFPKKPLASSWIVQLVGHEAAAKLCAHFDGIALNVPLGPAGSRARLHGAIDRARKDGMAQEKIARDYGIDRRTVQRSQARLSQKGARRDSRQGRLF